MRKHMSWRSLKRRSFAHSWAAVEPKTQNHWRQGVRCLNKSVSTASLGVALCEKSSEKGAGVLLGDGVSDGVLRLRARW